MSVLVVADSRGDGLQHILNMTATVERFRVLTYRGSGYELAAIRALPIIKAIKPDLIIFFLGICDLTTKCKASGLTSLRYTTQADNVQAVIEAAKASYTLLRSFGEHQISFATLTGIDLADYNYPARKFMSQSEYRRYCTQFKQVHSDQKLLNNSLLEINRQLTAINRYTATPTTWTGGVVHSYFKNAHHHYYKRLIDGCHADSTTKIKWAAQIIKSTSRILCSRPGVEICV